MMKTSFPAGSNRVGNTRNSLNGVRKVRTRRRTRIGGSTPGGKRGGGPSRLPRARGGSGRVLGALFFGRPLDFACERRHDLFHATARDGRHRERLLARRGFQSRCLVGERRLGEGIALGERDDLLLALQARSIGLEL